MNIIFANGATLAPLSITGVKRTVQGAIRDVLSFTFPENTSLDELAALFTPENCENIIITEPVIIPENGTVYENHYQHIGYTIREGIRRETLLVSPESADSPAVYEERITVSMAQRTYMETQLTSLIETIDILVLENLLEEVTE